MDWAAVSVVVILASGEPGDGSTRAITQALHSALSPDADISVRAPAKTAPDDAEIAQIANDVHAEYICVVSWAEQRHRAIVRFAHSGDTHFATRELRFDASDAPGERGRTVGFTLASMAPDEMIAAPDAKPPNPPPAPAPPVPLAPAPVTVVREVPTPAPPALPRENPLALDAVALAAGAPAGYGGGFGGAFAVRVPLAGAFGLHAALGGRAGSIGPAAASSHIFTGAAGLAWQPWLDARRRWAAGVRADVLATFIDVDHLDEDDTEAKHLSRFMGGGDALVEGTYRFASSAAVVAGAGAEVFFGQTDLFLHERKVAAILPARVVAELGLRVAFP